AFRFSEVFPFRGGNGRVWSPLPTLPGIPIRLNVFAPAFGNEPEAREDASPVNHVRPGLPPFLLFYADNDLPTLPAMAAEFCQTLVNQRVEASLVEVADRNHNSIMYRAIEPADPVARAMLEFIERHTAPPN